MTDLAAWLMVQIEADERRARANMIGGYGSDGVMVSSRIAGNGKGVNNVAVWTPARVLAECEAKRAVVELHSGLERDNGTHECVSCDNEGSPFDEWPCETLRILAKPYRDRDGWQGAWTL